MIEKKCLSPAKKYAFCSGELLLHTADKLLDDIIVEEVYEESRQEEAKSKQQMVFNFTRKFTTYIMTMC